MLFAEYLATHDDEKRDGEQVDDEDDRGDRSHVFRHRVCNAALRKRDEERAGKVNRPDVDAERYLRVHFKPLRTFDNGDDHGDGHDGAACFTKHLERPDVAVLKKERQNEQGGKYRPHGYVHMRNRAFSAKCEPYKG